MSEWIEYKENTRKDNTHSTAIIETLGKCRTQYFKLEKRPERTRLVKKELVKLGHSLNYKVYANGLSKDDLEEVNHQFVNREWLFDLHWYTEGKGQYTIESLPLVVECEWNPKRKGESTKLYGGIKYDFQKLVVSNAVLRVMIFIFKKEEELITLGNYFEFVINNYHHLKVEDKFLFIAYNADINGFYYREMGKN